MALTWKIGIGILILVGILASASLFFMLEEEGTTAPRPVVGVPLPAPDLEPLPRMEAPASLAARTADQLLDEMEFGTLAFNAPTRMNIKDSPQVQLLLSLSEAIDELKASISEEGERIGANIRVSDRMEARLSGQNFQITAVTPEVQAVSQRERTEWKWEVQPRKEGQHRLHLTLTALLDINGHSTPRSIRTFSETIDVNVTAPQKVSLFIQSHWQWLWAAILVPVAGWLWKRGGNY